MEDRAYFARNNGKKINLCGKKIVLPISIGQSYHEDVRFLSTINLLNEYEIQHCDIVAADTLQRHTLQINNRQLEIEYLHEKALMFGNMWLDRNINSINKLACTYNILRWDQWLFSQEYIKLRADIESLIQSNRDFYFIFTETANKFVERFIKRTMVNSIDINVIFNSCMNYVLEECSIMPLWAPKEYDYEVYPGKRIKAMKFVHEHFVQPCYPEALKWLRIHFKEAQVLSNKTGAYEKN